MTESLRSILIKAKLALKARDQTEAFNQLLCARTLAFSNMGAMKEVAQLFMEALAFSTAVNVFDDILDLEPTNIDARMGKLEARSFMRQEFYETVCLERMAGILLNDSMFPQSFLLRMAAVYNRLGLKRKSAKVARMALRNPDLHIEAILLLLGYYSSNERTNYSGNLKVRFEGFFVPPWGKWRLLVAAAKSPNLTLNQLIRLGLHADNNNYSSISLRLAKRRYDIQSNADAAFAYGRSLFSAGNVDDAVNVMSKHFMNYSETIKTDLILKAAQIFAASQRRDLESQLLSQAIKERPDDLRIRAAISMAQQFDKPNAP